MECPRPGVRVSRSELETDESGRARRRLGTGRQRVAEPGIPTVESFAGEEWPESGLGGVLAVNQNAEV